ncbi:MAG TPA: class I SAM-dependent methyltransferase [Patescibacteria group bacterium]
MQILSTTGWEEYALLDSGNGYRLEKFGNYILQRPDPQIIWKRKLPLSEWDKADAIFKRVTEDKGQWVRKNTLPDKWLVTYKDLSFWSKMSPFKHTGIFPEQHLQWDFIIEKIQKAQKPTSVLNLFAYTGIASLAAAAAGARVTHVDASKPTIAWAKENQEASNLTDRSIRWILDDAVKFTQREIKRGVKYDGIILDPPVFGHGPDGRVWKFNVDFPKLMELVKQVLSDSPLFVIVNAYAISSSSLMLQNVLEDYLGDLGGTITSGELVLQEKTNKRLLSTGIFARFEK